MNEQSAQLWAVIELFGRQVIAGAVSKVEPFGSPMVQVDVPATTGQPAFTRQFNPSAIYGITYLTYSPRLKPGDSRVKQR